LAHQPVGEFIGPKFAAMAPLAGHTGMTIGLEYFRDQRATSLYGLLVQPFLKKN
jgi:hypothetical protein